MAGNIETNLELEKILATLASLPQSTCQPNRDLGQEYTPIRSSETTLRPELVYRPEQELQGTSRQQYRRTDQPAPSHQPFLSTPQERVSTPPIDPSTITDWKQGLRCVSKIAAQNPKFSTSVRKLIKDQEQNVKYWETGCERLIADQKLKRENEETHRAVLSLPGLLDNTALLRTPAREREELDEYHAKVYRACKAMVESQTSSLRALGVPFFGVRPNLVVCSLDASSEAANAQASKSNGSKITRMQLKELQQKMLAHLQDLYED